MFPVLISELAEEESYCHLDFFLRMECSGADVCFMTIVYSLIVNIEINKSKQDRVHHHGDFCLFDRIAFGPWYIQFTIVVGGNISKTFIFSDSFFFINHPSKRSICPSFKPTESAMIYDHQLILENWIAVR